jgi:predicted transcriptional regulator YdeE
LHAGIAHPTRRICPPGRQPRIITFDDQNQQMKEVQINEELRLSCIKATSFPQGIVPAFTNLEQKIGGASGRAFYGLSRGNKNGIDYWAAVLSKHGEKLPAGLEEIVIAPGTYLTAQLSNWRGNEVIIGQTFQKMLDEPRLDPDGYCIEKYLDDDDVICMVRIIPV